MVVEVEIDIKDIRCDVCGKRILAQSSTPKVKLHMGITPRGYNNILGTVEFELALDQNQYVEVIQNMLMCDECRRAYEAEIECIEKDAANRRIAIFETIREKRKNGVD